MNKIYKATTVKNRGLFNRSIAGKVLFVLIGLMGACGYLDAQVTVLPGTTYTTLKAAFDAINAGTHTGAITINITGTSTETAEAVLNSSGTGAASYTSILIRPTIDAAVITGNLAAADIIQLNGSDNVTIDGDNPNTAGTNKNLTITNAATSGGPGIIWLSCASATDGATNNTIKNCNLTGASTTNTFVCIVSSGSTFGDIAETANANNSYLNNNISTSLYGLAVVGPTTMETGTVISGNTLTSTSFKTLFISNQQGVSVTGNTISGNISSTTLDGNSNSGIYVVGAISGGLIEKNKISNIKKNALYGCSGILLASSSTAANLTVANNFVWDVASSGWSSSNLLDDNGFGIAVSTGGGYKIYFNSVDLTTNQANGGIPCAFWISEFITTASSLDIRDNIFAVHQTTGTRYSIYSGGSSNNIFGPINYNDYYNVGPNVGYLGSAQTSLANWQAASGGDANSLAINPIFMSTSDIHLAVNSPLNNSGVSIGGITTDIDGDVRPATPDMGADEFTPVNCSTLGSITAGTISASDLNICPSSTATLSAINYSSAIGMVYQWEYFNGVSWVSLSGQTNPLSANTGSLAVTTQFRLAVKCNAGSFVYSTPITVNVNNPQVSGTTGASRCGTGSLSLSATAAAGTLNWYSAPTGGTAIATGSPFITPVINTTTNYYVSNVVTGSSVFVGPLYTGTDNNLNFTGSHGIAITTTVSNLKVNSADIAFTGTGTFTIALKDVTNTTVIASFTTGTVTGSGTTAVTVPMSITIPTAGDYLLIVNAVTGTINNLGISFDPVYPYVALGGQFTITSGYWYGADEFDHMYLFNLNIAGICEGTRTAVAATITTPPTFTSVSPAAGAPRTICSGTTVNLNVTSAHATYVYTWNPGSLAGASQTVNPTTTTSYTITADDGTCRRDSVVTITVNPTPTTLTVSPVNAASCAGIIVPISASGGILVGQSIVSEKFETFPLTQFTVTGTGVTATQNTTYFEEGSSSVLLTHSNSINGQLTTTNAINLSTYSNPKLSFYHICALEKTYDFGYVEYSTDGGTSWTTFPTSTYLGSGILQNSVVSFDASSYPDWNTQFTSATSTPGTGPATSLWKLETINLAPYQAMTNFKVRFKITSDLNTLYYGWLIDDVNITGDAQAPVTWSPVTELWLDPGCSTTPYVANTPALVVYSKPTVAHVYTATATGGIGCNKTATSTITLTAAAAASVTISAAGGSTICAGTAVTFTATPVNGGGNPGFKWFVNGTQVNLPLGYNSNPGHNPFTITGLTNGQVVTCQILSNAGGCVVPNNPVSAGTTMTVDPKPTVSIDGPLAVCFPANLTLTTTGPITTYQWYQGVTPVGTNLSTYTATVAGTYSTIVTTAAGCKDTSASKVLTQRTYNIVATATNGTISPSGTVSVICGANQTFTFTPNSGGYAVCDVTVDGVSQGVIPSYTFNNVTADHTIDVVFCISGCSTPSVAIAGPDGTSVCAGANYTLSGASISGPSGLTGTWSTSGTGTFNPSNVYGTATTYTPSLLDIGAGSVDITLTTNNPLGAPCAPASGVITLFIKPSPVVNVTGLLGICPSGTTTLTATATTSTGTITGYQWFNNVPSSIGTGTTHSFNAAGNFSVTATGSNGCFTNSPFTLINFTAPSTPTLPATATICVGGSTNLTATVGSPGNGGATIPSNGYQWYNPGSIAGATNQGYFATAIGTYTVTATNSNGCVSAASSPGTVVSYDNSAMIGGYTIGVGPASCTNYVSFATAISDLNTRGISGNVRFDIPAGYSETVPSPGLALGSTTLNPTIGAFSIIFSKSGAGANPILNAYVGTATPVSNTPDGIWSLRGVDNVSISNIDLFDGNTSGNALMEYGFGLFKLSVTDGAQNNTIRNCTITLKRANDVAGTAFIPDGSTGISVVNTYANAAATAVVPISANGANSNNKFYSNTIQNCNTGISLLGYSTASVGDTGNDIGGIASTTGNTIINFGGGATATSTAVGIKLSNQFNSNTSYNIINSNNGAGANHLGNLRGIYTQGGTSANVTISNNDITLKSSAVGSFLCTGIDNAIGATPATNTVSIINNTVTGTYATASGTSPATPTMTGIVNSANATTVNMNSNTVHDYSMPGIGAWVGIQNNGVGSTTVNMNSNAIQNCNITSTGAIACLSNNGSVVTLLSMSGNTISGNSKTATSATWLTTVNTTATTTATINANNIVNNTVTATAGPVTALCIGIGTCAYTISNNYIFNNSIIGLTSGVATLTGINSAAASTSETVTGNTVRKLFVTGTSASQHIIRGIYTNTVAGSNKTISTNVVSNLYCSSGLSATIWGITQATGTTVNIFRNKIDSLFPGQNGATVSYAAGIRVQSGTTVNVSNNFINLDLTQATSPAANSVMTGNDGLRGIEYAPTSGTVANIYFNTIRIAGAGSGTAFGTSGISITNVATQNVDLRNNIIVNLSTPGGTSPGFAVAYRRAAPVSSTYLTSSNNNIFYAGSPSTSRLLYFDGTTGYQTMLAYATGITGGRESASIGNALPNFINPISDLHLNSTNNCSAESAGVAISGYTIDYDNTARAATPDIGADEITGTGPGAGVWIGGFSSVWTDIQNWCDAVPDAKTNVTIPAGATFYPVITLASPVAIANNISIATNASVTITGSGKLGVYGTMASSGTFNVVDGTIELLGSTAQTIPAAVFQNNDLKNLVISNTAAAPSVTLAGALKLYGKLSFTKSNEGFATAGFLTLRSTATTTASVGDITNATTTTGNTITGDVSIERFISAKRAWRFLSVPTQNNALQTIHEAWQENQAANNASLSGYGIHITKDSANYLAYGFDLLTAAGGPSMKTYIGATNSWKGITSTVLVPGVSTGKFVAGTGYMTLVRGDRTVNTFPQAATTTVLRSKGAIYTGPFTSPSIPAGQFSAIGNPYPSAIDFHTVSRTNVQDAFYVWDPQVGTLGTFVSFIWNTTTLSYDVSANVSYPSNHYIESGQAFIVHNASASAGTITISEPNKVDGSFLVQRTFSVAKQIRTNLYASDTSGTFKLFDGVLSQFDGSYSTTVNDMDAVKISNFGENLGIKQDGKILSIERRAELTEADTIFYNIGNPRVQNYELEFVAENIGQPGLSGFLEDTYLHTSTPVSMDGTTKVDFNIVNDPGSYAADRFHLVFKQLDPVPVTFTSVRANKQDKNILVEWKVDNELNIHHYDVEKSADGQNFTKVHEEAARGTGAGSIQYSWLDTNPRDGDNFYRIRSVGISNNGKLSQIVKVRMDKVPSAITVFPNPVPEDGILYVGLDNKPAGIYIVNIVNAEGQTISKKTLNHAGGNSVYNVTPEKRLAHGNYLVNITGDNNVNLTYKVVY